MKFTSRRSAIACDSCRSAKRKCDGQNPCRVCIGRRKTCSWSAIGETSKARLEDRIANSLDAAPPGFSPYLNLSPDHQNTVSRSGAPGNISQAASPYDTKPSTSVLSTVPNGGALQIVVDNDSELPPLTIPLGHRCSNDSLLMLPQVQSLIGQYPEDFFFRVESQRLLPATQTFNPIDDQLELPRVDQETSLSLREGFFRSIHLVNPFLDESVFIERYFSSLDSPAGTLDERAVVLLVFAIGKIGGKPVIKTDENEELVPGMDLFKPAFHILTTSWTTCFSGDIILAQGLVLCALYLCYIAQPLRAWKLIHMASMTVQQLLIRSRNAPSDSRQADELSRVAWSCFLLESDLLSEFHQPRSGIEHMVDRMVFPGFGRDPKPENLAFLADISIRLLLNRAHYSMYSANTWLRAPDSSLITICTELYRQLRTWHDSLPEIIRPDLSSDEDANPQSHVLRLRYWSAKDILFRPFVIYVTTLPPDQVVSQIILDNCQLCLTSCRKFLYASEKLLSQYTSYTYSALHSCFGVILLLTLAALSPILESLVSDISDLQNMAVARLQPWAKPGTTIECALGIVKALQTKLRFR